MKSELADECDYIREAHYLQQFHSPDFLGTTLWLLVPIKERVDSSWSGNDSRFHVPWASSISSEKVLIMEYVEGGVSLSSELVMALPQEEKDKVRLFLQHAVHTCIPDRSCSLDCDNNPSSLSPGSVPFWDYANWPELLQLPLRPKYALLLNASLSNYSQITSVDSGKIALIDFGATREYGPEFLDGWRKLLEAAATLDMNDSSEVQKVAQGPAWDTCVEESISLGYLVGPSGEGEGFESPEMVAAHVTSLAFLAHPFNTRTPQPVRFGKGSEFGRNTERIRNDLIPVMLRDRKKGPPRETYSLNRKLSGAFLLASRLGATINARDIWEDVLYRHTQYWCYWTSKEHWEVYRYVPRSDRTWNL